MATGNISVASVACTKSTGQLWAADWAALLGEAPQTWPLAPRGSQEEGVPSWGGGSPGALPPHLWGTVAPPHLPALGTTQLRENQGPAPPRLGGPKARSPGPLHPAAVGAPAAAPVGRAPR